jgi:hypothetical protein
MYGLGNVVREVIHSYRYAALWREMDFGQMGRNMCFFPIRIRLHYQCSGFARSTSRAVEGCFEHMSPLPLCAAFTAEQQARVRG